MKLKESLKDRFSENELDMLVCGFDLIGNIAIIEIPEDIMSRKKDIALSVKRSHKHVKTVLMKSGERKGPFRLRGFRKLIGKETVTEHREHGCRFRLDVETCYFSPREATERQRIVEKVGPGENVLVMFAGIGPYSILIAKKQPGVKKVYSIEINPECVKYLRENIEINKVKEKEVSILGDVRVSCEKLNVKFDRIVMPLPKEGHKYLDVALKWINRGGVVHFYHYSHENDLWDETMGLIKDAAKESGREFKVLEKRKVLPYGPGVWKVCVDIEVTK
jgi:tRNA (guanine37-N1)-methyltransferase